MDADHLSSTRVCIYILYTYVNYFALVLNTYREKSQTLKAYLTEVYTLIIFPVYFKIYRMPKIDLYRHALCYIEL